MQSSYRFFIWKSLFVFFILIFLTLSLFGQERKKLSLKETLYLAKKTSLEAFKSKQEYAIEFLEYRSFRNSLLPQANIQIEPLTYTRSFVQRYDPENNIDVFRLQRNLNTYSNLSISQNILSTGATVFVNSSFNRLANFQDDRTIENYTTTPVRIGIIQPVMAYNALKWRKKTALLEFERAKKDFITKQQSINVKAVSFFFNWVLADSRMQIALENKANTDRLYSINKKRYNLGSIEKDDLLNLELEKLSAETELIKRRQEYQTAISELNLFLNVQNMEQYIPEIPNLIPNLKIEIEEAKQFAEKNNPELLNTKIRKINALRDLDKIIKENRFDLSFNASFGLNQQSDNLNDAYQNLLDQQLVAIRFSMPIIDWGERKGNIKTAKLNKEVTDIEIEQDANEVKRQLKEKVNEFNLQEEQIIMALKRKKISKESYQITEKRFFSGRVDLLRLLNAQKRWQQSSEEYIQSLKDYWRSYYEIQQLTLYNFVEQINIDEDFDRLFD